MESRLDMSGVYLSGAVRFKEHRIKVKHYEYIFPQQLGSRSIESRLDILGVYFSAAVRFKEHRIKVGHVRSISFSIS